MSLTENDKLKYWLDGEIAVLHIFLSLILFQLVEVSWQRTGIVIYIILNAIYYIVRMGYVAHHDPDYLKIPKK